MKPERLLHCKEVDRFDRLHPQRCGLHEGVGIVLLIEIRQCGVIVEVIESGLRQASFLPA